MCGGGGGGGACSLQGDEAKTAEGRAALGMRMVLHV